MVTCRAPHQLWKGCSFCSCRVFKRVSQCLRSFPLIPNAASSKAQSSYISFSFQLPASFFMTSPSPPVSGLQVPVVHIQLKHPTLLSSHPTYSPQQRGLALVLPIHAAFFFSLGAVGKEMGKPRRILPFRAHLSACMSSVLQSEERWRFHFQARGAAGLCDCSFLHK